jgi:hypothetical protein
MTRRNLVTLKTPVVYNVQWCDLGGINRLYMGEEIIDEEFKQLIRECREKIGTPIPRSQKMEEFDKAMEERGYLRVVASTHHVWPMLQEDV